MAKLHIAIGLPGSGKSTHFTQHDSFKDAVILSSDELRQELLGNVNDQSDNAKVFDELHKRALHALSEGKDVVLDSTNVTMKTRRIIFDKFRKKADMIVAHYFNTSYEVCLKRNKGRERHVPEHVIARMYKALQIPLYYEGWDNIIFHNDHGFHVSLLENTTKGFMEFISREQSYESIMGGSPYLLGGDEFKNIFELAQDNSHHAFTVSRHTYYVWKHLLDNYKGEDKLKMLISALYHDTGKYFCKSFIKNDGSIGRYANFIGHENVSAQIAANRLIERFPLPFVLEVVEIVQNHMRLMRSANSDNDSEKADKKLRKLVGDELFENLVLFREADTSAK